MSKIILGDCLEEMKKMADNSVDLTLTDIPYGEVSENGAERAKYGGQLRKLDKGDADVLGFDLSTFVSELDRVTNGSIYVFCGKEQFSQILSQLKGLGWSVRAGVWEKTNPTPMNGQHLWLSSVEMCVFARKAKATFNQSCKSSVWRFPNGSSKVHPTQKPLNLFKYLVQSSSSEGEIVFDPCLGSGTTALAARQLNRDYIGIEINPDYVKIAQERLKQEVLL